MEHLSSQPFSGNQSLPVVLLASLMTSTQAPSCPIQVIESGSFWQWHWSLKLYLPSQPLLCSKKNCQQSSKCRQFHKYVSSIDKIMFICLESSLSELGQQKMVICCEITISSWQHKFMQWWSSLKFVDDVEYLYWISQQILVCILPLEQVMHSEVVKNVFGSRSGWKSQCRAASLLL